MLSQSRVDIEKLSSWVISHRLHPLKFLFLYFMFSIYPYIRPSNPFYSTKLFFFFFSHISYLYNEDPIPTCKTNLLYTLLNSGLRENNERRNYSPDMASQHTHILTKTSRQRLLHAKRKMGKVRYEMGGKSLIRNSNAAFARIARAKMLVLDGG